MTTDITDLRSGTTEIDTYRATMTVKYQLKSAGVIASSKFHRKDTFRDSVDGNLCYYMQAYRFRHKAIHKARSNVKTTREINSKEKS